MASSWRHNSGAGGRSRSIFFRVGTYCRVMVSSSCAIIVFVVDNAVLPKNDSSKWRKLIGREATGDNHLLN